MAVPKYFEMNKPFLEYLKDGNKHPLGEIKRYVIQTFHITQDELEERQPSGRQTVFANRIGWSSTYLKKAGLIESPARATFQITKAGLDVLKENPNVIDVKYLMRFESFRNFQDNTDSEESSKTTPKTGKENKNKMVDGNTDKTIINENGNRNETINEGMNENETPDDIFEDAFKIINKKLQDEVLSEVMKLSPVAFEQMVLDLMAKMGYGTFANAARTTAVTGDEGIDGIIMEDKLGFSLIYIQAKKWGKDHHVGRPEVQAFVGAIAGKSGKGMFVTTSKFSKAAVEYAEKQHIVLMDGEKLAKLMIEHNFGVRTKQTFEIKTLDMDVFDEYAEE